MTPRTSRRVVRRRLGRRELWVRQRVVGVSAEEPRHDVPGRPASECLDRDAVGAKAAGDASCTAAAQPPSAGHEQAQGVRVLCAPTPFGFHDRPPEGDATDHLRTPGRRQQRKHIPVNRLESHGVNAALAEFVGRRVPRCGCPPKQRAARIQRFAHRPLHLGVEADEGATGPSLGDPPDTPADDRFEEVRR
jgi:hypothetical protein